MPRAPPQPGKRGWRRRIALAPRRLYAAPAPSDPDAQCTILDASPRQDAQQPSGQPPRQNTPDAPQRSPPASPCLAPPSRVPARKLDATPPPGLSYHSIPRNTRGETRAPLREWGGAATVWHDERVTEEGGQGGRDTGSGRPLTGTCRALVSTSG